MKKCPSCGTLVSIWQRDLEPVPKGVIFYNERHEPQAVPQ